MCKLLHRVATFKELVLKFPSLLNIGKLLKYVIFTVKMYTIYLSNMQKSLISTSEFRIAFSNNSVHFLSRTKPNNNYKINL
jgi:hypothetical protein